MDNHILSMRFIAQWFVRLMETYKFLETSAFLVIAILGIKLLLSIVVHFYPESSLGSFLSSRLTEIAMSMLTIFIFFVPIIVSRFLRIKQDLSQ